MLIELRPDIQASEGVPVGLLDGMPLVYIGRIPYVAGQQYRQAEIAPALYEAIQRAASKLWGNEWNGDLARVTGLNRRTVAQDRICKYGLPAWVLVLLGNAAAKPCPRALGYIMLGSAELHGRMDKDAGKPENAPSNRRNKFHFELHEAMRESVDLISFARGRRAKHRATLAVQPDSQ